MNTVKIPDAVLFPDVPADLREWVDERSLVNIALDAVQPMVGSGQDSATRGMHLPPGMPRALCTLLTYCYAIGIYGSAEIETRIASDPLTGYLCAGAYPYPHELRRFRRQHRVLIQAALSKVLRLAWEFRRWKFALGVAPDDELSFRSPRTGSDVALDANFTRTAEERVQQAVLADSMALDD